MTNIELTIKALVEAVLEEPVTSLDQDLRNDLGLDSLDMIELFFDIDKEFGVNISDATWEAANVRTVRDLSATVTDFLKP